MEDSVSSDAIQPISRRPTQVSVLPPLGPHARRFRHVAKKVIQAHRTAALFGRFGAGAEPGVDVRQPAAHDLYSHLKRPCTINVVDYNTVHAAFSSYKNAEFLRVHPLERESWVKVRWIHVDGISWDVLSQLALTYDMHPLALEDVLLSRPSSRTKASYYLKHLFLRVACHTVGQPENDSFQPRTPSHGAEPLDAVVTIERRNAIGEDEENDRSNRPEISRSMSQQWADREARELQQRAESSDLHAIKDDLERDRVHVDLSNLFIFLFRDGTVITFHNRPGTPYRYRNASPFFEPIMNRLRSSKSILRTSADASVLVQSLLDLVVDEALDIVDEYRDLLIKLESQVLVAPTTDLVRVLHIVSGDLALRKHSLQPVKSLVFGLRRYDLDRSIALAPEDGRNKLLTSGFMSSKAKIYLTDVNDHIQYVLSSIDQFSTQSENLISYTFNLSSSMISRIMSRLTLVTVIFMPPILLAGYFGMNFHPMWSVNQNSDALYWKIIIPMLAVILPAFLWADMQRAAHRMRKEFNAKKVEHNIIRQFSSRAGRV